MLVFFPHKKRYYLKVDLDLTNKLHPAINSLKMGKSFWQSCDWRVHSPLGGGIKPIPQLVQIFKLKKLYDKNLFFFFHCQQTATTQGKQKPK